MRRTLLSIAALCLFAFGCGQQTNTESSWAFDLVNWNQHVYKVTSDKVTDVGKQIGSVSNYSDDESANQLSGTFSNKFPVGTNLFEIKGTSTSTAIAVQTSDGTYVKAIDQGAYTPPSNTTK